MRSWSGHRIPVAVAAAVVAILFTAACGGSGEVTLSGSGAETGETMEEPASSGGGIVGDAVLVSDVQIQGDAAWGGAATIAFPVDALDVLWEAVDAVYIDRPSDLRRLGVLLDTSRLPSGAVLAEADASGRFASAVPDGEYVLCVGETVDAGVDVYGCADVAAPNVVTVSFGEAGVVVG